MSDERRTDERFLACFAAAVEHDAARTRSALIEDVSVSGARLLTRARVEQDDTVRLEITLSDDEPALDVTARVVRVESVSSTLWTKRIAVEFDTPLTAYEEAIKAISEQQTSQGILGPNG